MATTCLAHLFCTVANRQRYLLGDFVARFCCQLGELDDCESKFHDSHSDPFLILLSRLFMHILHLMPWQYVAEQERSAILHLDNGARLILGTCRSSRPSCHVPAWITHPRPYKNRIFLRQILFFYTGARMSDPCRRTNKVYQAAMSLEWTSKSPRSLLQIWV